VKIPNKIKIAGIPFKIIKNYKFKEEIINGQIDYETGEIRLNPVDRGGYKRIKERIEETFIHEILHGINEFYNAGQLNEETISRLSHGIYQVFNDNKMLR